MRWLIPPRYNTGVALEESDKLDSELTVALSEARLIKDEIEVENLQRSVDMTVKGFEEVVRELPKAVAHHRGERVVETAFFLGGTYRRQRPGL